MDTWRNSGQVFKMTKSVKNEGGAENISHFLLVQPWERNRGKKMKSPRLLSMILEVLSVEVHRAKN